MHLITKDASFPLERSLVTFTFTPVEPADLQTHADSGLHESDPLWTTASARSTGGGVQRRRPPLMCTSCGGGCSPGDQRPVSRQPHGRQAQLWLSKHTPAPLAACTNLWCLCLMPRGRRGTGERSLRSETVSRGLMVQLPTPCTIVIRTNAARDTIPSSSELI